MIQEGIMRLAGLVVGSVILLFCLSLALSVPIVFTQGLLVLLRREWIPPTYNLRSIAKRRLAALATVFGLALVVFVLTATSMLAAGIQHTLASTGDPRNAKIFMKGVGAEGQSNLSRSQLNLLSVIPGVATNDKGERLFSPELLVLAWAKADGADVNAGANLSLRGVSRMAYELHPPRQLEGRRAKPGAFEIVIGAQVENRFKGAELGGTMELAGHDWSVVGVADHAGTAYDSEAWADLDQVRSTFHRDASVTTLALGKTASIASLEATLVTTPVLANLQVRREIEYWESLGQQYVDFVRLVGSLVGLIFALAAVLGAMNTMYAQVSARTRELGALRAIGFRPRAILASLVLESTLMGLIAGSIGIGVAGLLSGVDFELTSEKTLTEMTYAFHFSLPIALGGLLCAGMLGYAGGLLPALRAARMRIVDAVRAD